MDNLRAIVGEITRNKPTGGKGELIRTASLASTMGPGVRLELTELKTPVGTRN